MLRRTFVTGTLLATGALLSACDDATSPRGETSVASVHAYVDVDGSGTITDGDDFISGATITLQETGGTGTETAQTNAFGVALFPTLEPGSYRVTMAGAVPEGAVLATASNPVLVAPFLGDSVAQEFRFVYNPGSISGVLFRDENANGVYDDGVDTPAPGMPLRLFVGTDTLATPIATGATDEDGAFVFQTLRAGEYTLVVTPIPTITIVGGNARSVTVEPNAPTQTLLTFTGNLLQPIAVVRDAPQDQIVAFEGVATVSLGIFSSSTTGNQFNVQDATGGVLVLDTPLDLGIEQGDSVRVIGRTQVSSGEFVIRDPTITVLGTGTVPAPRTVTPAQVATSTATDDIQGQLVRVGNVRVTAVSGTAASTSYNVTVEDDEGSSFIVRVGSANVGIAQTYWQIGRSYDVTGTLGNFNGGQVKVRSAADVELRSSATDIGVVRAMAFADSAGTKLDTVTVEGVVHTAQGTFRSDNAFIQDETGGILLFNVPTDAALAVGDTVRVTAAIDWFNGELELVRFSSTSPPIIESLGSGPTPAPRTISGAQVLSRDFEGQLVRLGNAVVDSVGVPSGSGGYTVWVIATDGSRIEVRVENSSIGIAVGDWTIGSIWNVVGALSHFRGIPQLKPRGAADVTAGAADINTIQEVKAFPPDDTVSVEGIVTAPVGLFNSIPNTYIQDGTGGIQIFGLPAGAAVNPGDVVRVRGITGVFSGEFQIERFGSSEPLEVTVVSSGPVPAPLPVTGAQVLARTYEGSLVQLDSVVVQSIGSVSGSGGYSVTVRTQDGSDITLRHDRAAVGVPVGTFVVGDAYDVTGVLTAFNSAPQLKFRGPDDVVRR